MNIINRIDTVAIIGYFIRLEHETYISVLTVTLRRIDFGMPEWK